MISLSNLSKKTFYFCSVKFKNQMGVLIILIGVSILVALGFLIAFIWSVKTGQYEDDYTPSVRMLFDNEPTIINTKEEKSIINNQ